MDGHGQADSAGLSGMNIRHDSYGTAFGNLVVTEHLKLGKSISINGSCRVVRGKNSC